MRPRQHLLERQRTDGNPEFLEQMPRQHDDLVAIAGQFVRR
jgi:hypothetical protein